MEVDSGQELRWEAKPLPQPLLISIWRKSLSSKFSESLKMGSCLPTCVKAGRGMGSGGVCARAQDEDLESLSLTGLSPECPF